MNGIVKNIEQGQPERRGRVARTDEPLQGDALRVERPLAHADPTSADHALVRFAADKIVAGLPDAGFEEHEVLLRAKQDEARLVAEALDRLAELDSAMDRTAEAAADALRESRFVDLEMTLADAESGTVDADVRRSVEDRERSPRPFRGGEGRIWHRVGALRSGQVSGGTGGRAERSGAGNGPLLLL